MSSYGVTKKNLLLLSWFLDGQREGIQQMIQAPHQREWMVWVQYNLNICFENWAILCGTRIYKYTCRQMSFRYNLDIRLKIPEF